MSRANRIAIYQLSGVAALVPMVFATVFSWNGDWQMAAGAHLVTVGIYLMARMLIHHIVSSIPTIENAAPQSTEQEKQNHER